MWEAERRLTDEYQSEKSTPIFFVLAGCVACRWPAFCLYFIRKAAWQPSLRAC